MLKESRLWVGLSHVHIQSLKARFRERDDKRIHIKSPDNITAAFAFSMLDAFLTLVTEALEEHDQELLNRLIPNIWSIGPPGAEYPFLRWR